jgi:hypothetical protein
MWLNVVPEPKTVKHRVHLDVHVAAVSDLIVWAPGCWTTVSGGR